MASSDHNDFALHFWELLLDRLLERLPDDVDEERRRLVRRVIVRLSLESEEETVEEFPLWDARPILSAVLLELGQDQMSKEEVSNLADKYVDALSAHFAGAMEDDNALKEMDEFCEAIDDSMLEALDASRAADEAAAAEQDDDEEAEDEAAEDGEPEAIMEPAAEDAEPLLAEEGMPEMPDPAMANEDMAGGDDLLADAAGGGSIDDLESLLGGGDDIPDLLGGDMPDLLGADGPMEGEIDTAFDPLSAAIDSVGGSEMEMESVDTEMSGEEDDADEFADLEGMDLSQMANMDESQLQQMLSQVTGEQSALTDGPAGDDDVSAEAMANLEHELEELETLSDSLMGNEEIDGLDLMAGSDGEPEAPREVPIESMSFEDQIRTRMLKISEAVEELAEGGGKQVVDALIEQFAAISRPITRSGYRTFASLADVLVSTLEYLRSNPIETPPSLCNNLRELVMTLNEIVDGRWSKYRTFYWLINKLNATQREMEEEVEQLEEQRIFGGYSEHVAEMVEAEAADNEARVAPRSDDGEELQRAELTDLQEIFVQEANEHIDLLNRNLLIAEKNPTDQETIYTLMRSAHSIKGSANISKYTHIGSLAHVMEDVMVAIRDNGLMMTPSIIDLLLASVDRLSGMLAGVEYNREFDEKSVEKLRGQLNALAEELQTNPDRYKAGAEAIDQQLEKKIGLKIDKKVEAQQDTRTDAQREANTVRVDIEDLNLLRNLAAELVINRTRLSGQLEQLRGILDGYQREKKLLSNVLLRLDRAIEDISREMNTLFANTPRYAAAAGDEGGALAINMGQRIQAFEQSMTRLLRVRESGILREFADSEFDRFSELDIVWRDTREVTTHLTDLGDHFEGISTDLDQNISRISNIANDLHEQIMRVRMIPIGRIFNRFPRTVRDMARRLNKSVELVTVGEETPLDKMIIEEIGDPLMHMVRNAVDHGIESKEERSEFGKPEQATIKLSARQEGNQVVIAIEDDGRGIDVEAVKRRAIERGILTADQADRASDTELINLIFAPGFSTAKETTDISGRGVGMDVVKTVITKLKGTVSVTSELGEGTRMTIRLPLTLAISQALLFSASNSRFAIPLLTVDETVMVREDALMRTMGQELIKLRKDLIPVVRLNNVMSLGASEDSDDEKPVIVINTGNRRVGIIVDRLIGREEIVVKNLGRHLRKLPYVSGGTILGDGMVTLILDIFSIVDESKPIRSSDLGSIEVHASSAPAFDTTSYKEVIEEAREKVSEAKASSMEMPAVGGDSKKSDPIPSAGRSDAGLGGHHILVTDDSISIRRFVGSILESHGYRVTLANDGVDALEKLKGGRFDLILTDLEMPRMHGYELIAEVKQNIAYKSIPIIILTGRAGEKHSRKGMELGASAFLVKPFNEQELLSEIAKNIGSHSG